MVFFCLSKDDKRWKGITLQHHILPYNPDILQYKLALILIIIFLLTLLVSIRRSQKKLWRADNSRNSRMFTWRSIAVISIILLFVVFSLFR